MNFYEFCVIVVRSILYVIIRFRAYGSGNVPKEGAFLLCANHKSNIDPVLLAAGADRQMTFMAKDELFHVPLTQPLFSPRADGCATASARR